MRDAIKITTTIFHEISEKQGTLFDRTNMTIITTPTSNYSLRRFGGKCGGGVIKYAVLFHAGHTAL